MSKWKTAALFVAIALVLWLEVQILFSIRVTVFVYGNVLWLEAVYLLALAACLTVPYVLSKRDAASLPTLFLALGGPVVLWVSVRGWAPSTVGINVSPYDGVWMVVHSGVTAGFVLLALHWRFGRGVIRRDE